MRNCFRDGFYAGTGLALILTLYLLWLWNADHQVRLHSNHLLRTLENKNWSKFATFLADDYHDQWGQDHAVALERAEGVFRYLRGIRLLPGYVIVQAAEGKGSWQAKITIEGSDSELTGLVKERVNSLGTPFTLVWQRASKKPWDWKLVGVTNPALEMPAGFE